MGVAGGISAYCSQSYPLTAGRFLIVDLVVGGIGSRLPLNVDLKCYNKVVTEVANKI